MDNTDFDLALAKMLAAASAAAYADSPSVIRSELRAASVETFADGPIVGYLASVGEETILAFRGTMSPLSDWQTSIRHWVANLDFHQIAISAGRVHRGFHRALDGVWRQARPLVNKGQPPQRFWVTGHSLGGALAILAGMRLHEEGVEVSGVYTFGAPAIGDSTFAGAYKPPLHRIENTCDVICHLPPSGKMIKLASNIFGSLIVPADAQYDSVGKVTVAAENGSLCTIHSPTDSVNASRLRFLELTLAAGADVGTFLDEHKIDSYLARLAKGRIERGSSFIDISRRLVGTILKLKKNAGILRDAAGQVVGFLQETGLLQKTIANEAVGGIIGEAGEIAKNAPLGQVFSLLSSLRLLNGATLAATVVGIGVNVAGFALVLNRLKRVELIASDAKREAIAARLAAERVDVQLAARNLGDTMAHLQLAEEAWSHSDPVSIWKSLQLPLVQQISYEQCLLGKGARNSIFLDDRFAFEEAIAAYESLLLLDAARFQTLLLMEEKRAALFAAETFLAWHRDAVFQLTPDEIARATSLRRAGDDTRKEPDVRRDLLRMAETFKERVLEINQHVAARIELIRYLIAKEMSGRAYVDECRQNMDSPLMILPVDN
ncbi:MAG: lipase family protein [Planctomycetes bacterium]|nr:lipase family protein [Planctomycetota bacterium]